MFELGGALALTLALLIVFIDETSNFLHTTIASNCSNVHVPVSRYTTLSIHD
jgi:hypothetical protein